MTSTLYVDVMSLPKQVITTIFYIIIIKIEFSIMTDHYYVSCILYKHRCHFTIVTNL